MDLILEIFSNQNDSMVLRLEIVMVFQLLHVWSLYFHTEFKFSLCEGQDNKEQDSKMDLGRSELKPPFSHFIPKLTA